MSQPASALSPAHAALLASAPARPGAVIDTATVDYQLAGTVLEGYLAVDTAATKRRPGVLLMHDWGGVGPYVNTNNQGHAAVATCACARR